MKKQKMENDENDESNSQLNEEENDEIEDEMEDNGEDEEPYIDQDKERDFYERALLDFYRFKHPNNTDFINCITDMFQTENYIIKDYMSCLSKDAKCCLINYLTVFDICRLARTCSSYKEIVDSPKYNEYWRNRFNTKFPISYVEKNGTYLYRGKPKNMLWFDIYQYSIFYNKVGFNYKEYKRLTLNKQSLHSFVRAKRKGFPGVCKLNVYFRGDWKIRECLNKEFQFKIADDLTSLIGLDSNIVTGQKFEKVWVDFCMSHFYKLQTLEDLIEYTKTFNVNHYWGRKGCLFNVPQDFKEKWRLMQTQCSCPYDNALKQNVFDSLPKMCNKCPINWLKGSVIYEPLDNEAKKYLNSYY